ncbi:hypothetical protein CDL15_Pgr019230 [Punica granatum]|uniref:Uncharacterized protein n=1 Tax=Punica granatum TaxID=22663 RepID=A0A218W5D1_PUNGR|nr:hypothetical protein CDL15_Pgr019230 [Punica granatum]
MAPSFVDSPFSGLLCVEDNNSVFLFDDNESPRAVDSSDAAWHRQGSGFDDAGEGEHGQLSEREMLLSEEGLGGLLEKESQYMPDCEYVNRLRSGDLDIGARKEAVDWIREVHAHFRFGPLSAYLSIGYFDRFLSAYELPKGKAWMTQLLAVACLSLAAKLEEIEIPLPLDLQADESKYIFEARTVERMELLVLSKLSWRMQAVTPFSFVDHFLRKINGDKMPTRATILKSIQIISSTIEVIEFLEFKPSDIAAAAAAISVEGESRTVDTTKAVLILSQHVEKERVLKCIGLIHDLVLTGCSTEGAATTTSVPQSPIGVLDASCLSYRSEETACGSCNDSSHHNTPQTKRTKLDR